MSDAMPAPARPTRRDFILSTAAAIWSVGCRATTTAEPGDGHLRSTPGPPSAVASPGEHPLGLGAERDGVLYVPRNEIAAPSPLVVLLHGAGGNARGLSFARPLAEELGIVLLIPESRGGTWDGIRGALGPDVAFIDAALAQTFARCAIDPTRIGVGGFSDGASYALSIGMINGDLFSHVLAFSPGFIVPGERRGRPGIFISHGTRDAILPIDRTSRTLVPALTGAGYDVIYREFDGPHRVPPDTARDGFEWFVKRTGDAR
jgi:predicted esterase